MIYLLIALVVLLTLAILGVGLAVAVTRRAAVAPPMLAPHPLLAVLDQTRAERARRAMLQDAADVLAETGFIGRPQPPPPPIVPVK